MDDVEDADLSLVGIQVLEEETEQFKVRPTRLGPAISPPHPTRPSFATHALLPPISTPLLR